MNRGEAGISFSLPFGWGSIQKKNGFRRIIDYLFLITDSLCFHSVSWGVFYFYILVRRGQGCNDSYHLPKKKKEPSRDIGFSIFGPTT